MKFGGVGHHAFGEAIWWGHELFGIDNALVGDWPVVQVEAGKARIQEMVSIIDWLKDHTDVLVRHLRAMNLMWTSATPAPSEHAPISQHRRLIGSRILSQQVRGRFTIRLIQSDRIAL